MAVFPCDRQPHRYLGPQRSAYITRFHGSVVMTRKLRLCQTHYEEIAAVAAGVLELVEEGSNISLLCSRCGDPFDEGLSVRLYDEHEPPAVYAGEFCAAHAEAVADTLGWGSGRPL